VDGKTGSCGAEVACTKDTTQTDICWKAGEGADEGKIILTAVHSTTSSATCTIKCDEPEDTVTNAPTGAPADDHSESGSTGNNNTNVSSDDKTPEGACNESCHDLLVTS